MAQPARASPRGVASPYQALRTRPKRHRCGDWWPRAFSTRRSLFGGAQTPRRSSRRRSRPPATVERRRSEATSATSPERRITKVVVVTRPRLFQSPFWPSLAPLFASFAPGTPLRAQGTPPCWRLGLAPTQRSANGGPRSRKWRGFSGCRSCAGETRLRRRFRW